MPGPKPKRYDPELVAAVREIYASGASMRATAEAVGISLTVIARLMERHGIERRDVGRDQRGEKNTRWQGADADYYACHLRVRRQRGTPSTCERCGTTEGRMEWANLTGDYPNVNDYERMCVPCHRKFDAERRRETGQPTSPIAASCVVESLEGAA